MYLQISAENNKNMANRQKTFTTLVKNQLYELTTSNYPKNGSKSVYFE